MTTGYFTRQEWFKGNLNTAPLDGIVCIQNDKRENIVALVREQRADLLSSCDLSSSTALVRLLRNKGQRKYYEYP